jgi:hypothetical protein
MTRASRIVASVIGLSAVIARAAHGQSHVVIQPARRDTLLAEPGSAVTFAFEVRNPTGGVLRAQPRVVAPKGWSVVIGVAPFAIAAKSRDTWLVGVASAATSAAGTYAVRAALITGTDTVRADSVMIRVPERHGLDVYPGDVPSFVMSGDGYPVRFFVHNRGNVAATFSLRATTSFGVPLDLDQESVTVDPGATATVVGRTANSRPESNTRECTVELTAIDDADSTVASSASVRTTIVPRGTGWLDQFSTVPAEAMVRTVGRGAGVSPAALWGSGRISPESNTQLDFLFRAPVNGQPIYGERDEYRVALSADRYRLRLGDNLFGFSQLTSSWTTGFGAEGTGQAAGMTAGGYVKENRWNRAPGTEEALMFGTSPSAPVAVSLIGVDRTGGTLPGGRVGSFAAQAHFGARSVVEVEGALSDSAGTPGEAHRARLSGDLSVLSYDLSVIRGTPEFAGRDRGQTTGHGGLSARFGQWATFSGNYSTFRYTPTLSLGGLSRMEFRDVEGSVIGDRLAVAYEETTQGDSGSVAALGRTQRGFRIRGTLPLGPLELFSNVGEGTAHDLTLEDHRYQSIMVSLRARLGGVGSIELFGQRSSGLIFETPGSGVGASADLHFPWSTNLRLSGYGDALPGQTSLYFAQVDAELSHQLANGLALVLRDRFDNYAWRVVGPRSNLLFLELRAPLRIPTAFRHSTGIARGKILDEETGLGVGGALVRLGPEAAVSDKDGQVTFASLAPGVYHATVDGAAGSREVDALLTRDVAVEVPRESRTPVEFSLSLARGGEVRVGVRQFDFATTIARAASDSLVDGGGFANAMIALVGARDTIYQVTNQDGVADFRDIPVGHWLVKVLAGSLPTAQAVEQDERWVKIEAGQRATVGFRVVPKRRAIQLMDSPAPVIAKPAPGPGSRVKN